jgi:SAM-dependent methyltransferase
VTDDVLTRRDLLRDRQYAGPDNLAARQRLWAHRAGPSPIRERLDLLGLGGAEAVLDVGCGNGTYLAELRRRRHRGRLVGADLSLGMARVVAADGGTPVVADAAHLPFPDAAFDAVLAMHMLYHVPQPDLAVRELRRVLRVGGTLLAATNGAAHIREINAVVDAAARAVTGRQRTAPEPSFTLESGERLLRSAFRDVTRRAQRDIVIVPDARIVVGYIASFQPEYAGVPDGPQWTRFGEAVADLVDEHVRRHGNLPVTAHTGVFVCR